MSSPCGSATALDQKPHSASAPPVAYTSELQTPTEEPTTRSGTMPSSSSRFRQPAWYAPRDAPPPRMNATFRFFLGAGGMEENLERPQPARRLGGRTGRPQARRSHLVLHRLGL